MLKKLLAERGVILTEELSDAVTADIKFNKIRFNKKTSLKDLLDIATTCALVLKKCA